MKRFLSYCIFVLILPSVLMARTGKVFDNLILKSNILNMDRKYSVYLPPDYNTSNRSYLVLYLLHGSGDNQASWIQFGEVNMIADKTIAEGKSVAMIIVMADATTGRSGYFNTLRGDSRYEDFFFKDFTIKNSANWAFNLRYCSFGKIDKISIRGGHDGLHTRFCNNFTVTKCDFRTGDDAFAGNDNRDFSVSDCKINTSCNGFRVGCYNFTVKNCKLWGLGEYFHKIQKRNNMLAAFVHFSPNDDNSKLQSGNWLIENCTVDQVDNFYNYNYDSGLWQTGQPVASIRFENIKATGLLNAFAIIGDQKRQLQLTIKNSIFSFREGVVVKEAIFEGAKSASEAFFNVSNFGQIELQNVTLKKVAKNTLIDCESGNKIIINGLHSDSPDSYLLKDIKQIIK